MKRNGNIGGKKVKKIITAQEAQYPIAQRSKKNRRNQYSIWRNFSSTEELQILDQKNTVDGKKIKNTATPNTSLWNVRETKVKEKVCYVSVFPEKRGKSDTKEESEWLQISTEAAPSKLKEFPT